MTVWPITFRKWLLGGVLAFSAAIGFAQQEIPWGGGMGSWTDLVLRSAPDGLPSGRTRPSETMPGRLQFGTRHLDQNLIGSLRPLRSPELVALWNQDNRWRWGGSANLQQLAPNMSILNVRLSALKWVRIDADHSLCAGIGLGVIRMQLDPGDGVWESQYLLNPLNPAAVPSGEVSWRDFQRVAPDFAGHLGVSTAGKGQWLYGFRHLPFPFALLYGSAQRGNLHHELTYRRSGVLHSGDLQFQWTAELAAQRQSGGQSFHLNAWTKLAFRPASVYTGLERPPRALLGFQLASHGLLTPMAGMVWRDDHRLFVSHTMDLRSTGGYSAWCIGLTTVLE